MARPRISTGTGDDGMTGLLRGERVLKSAMRVHAIGTVDELNAILGVVLSGEGLPETLRTPLERVQRALFNVGADIAAPDMQSHRLSAVFIGELEQWGVAMEAALPSLSEFILPGGSRIAALLHQARAVCRRAERWIVGLAQEEPVNPEVRVYVNRLSDCLFLAARMANHVVERPENKFK
ncbi:MAG: cob(I)yrinic acid a,c-diamide adenosyltransferase [Candidatus Peribacteraceae bacterium]|nr:cob(I)yrinic acid a,c-diamide adenosyltransferase [Candidatus Peribacteraceae bacterium]MDD5739495.1 cob(I)yrinic acid a,c-diamide adenosyltransferase [Candidatus Peribacteraceae bacterium]